MKPPPMCRRCGNRWAQARNLCRRCGRETGVDGRSTFERDRDRLARAQQAVAERRPLSGPIAPGRTVIVNGQEFEVVWDGSVAGS